MTSDAGSTERAPDLRSLPSVEQLAAALDGVPHALAVRAAREAIEARRAALRSGAASDGWDARDDALARAAEAARPHLRRVINASGVIVHTNLGRAPLPPAALDALAEVASGYTNLEYDTESGARGSRHAHVEDLLRELTGAEAAMAVNNCAGAVLLAAAALASGREVVVSRGQLVEIGGSFRVPDVLAQSGARLVEVGTTNRTRLADYERAIGRGGADVGALMRAHQSNFRTVGFTEDVEIEALCELGVPVIDDVGSGALAERLPELADEPPVRRSVAAGCAVVCFSGDKLLGGPQAGLLVGRADAIELCRRHPLARALRIDKLSLAALEATLRIYREPQRALTEIPVLRMLAAGDAELRARAELMRAALAEVAQVDVIEAGARVGGGALPLLELEGPVCAVDPGALGADELARRLRTPDPIGVEVDRGTGGEVPPPPVIGRVRDGWLLLDPRTLDDAEARAAAAAVRAALAR